VPAAGGSRWARLSGDALPPLQVLSSQPVSPASKPAQSRCRSDSTSQYGPTTRIKRRGLIERCPPIYNSCLSFGRHVFFSVIGKAQSIRHCRSRTRPDGRPPRCSSSIDRLLPTPCPTKPKTPNTVLPDGKRARGEHGHQLSFAGNLQGPAAQGAGEPAHSAPPPS